MANAITPDLRRAYRRCIYCVFASSGVVEIIVNESDIAMDNLLAEHNVTSAAFITAWNPASRRLDDGANANRNKVLQADIKAAGFSYISGEGRDPAGEWPPEQSLLILGIARAEATKLARRHGQNAYVFLQMHSPAILVEV